MPSFKLSPRFHVNVSSKNPYKKSLIAGGEYYFVRFEYQKKK